jgi:hypothetical protein
MEEPETVLPSRHEERLRMRFSDMMGSGDDGSAARDGDTVVAQALTPYLTAPEPDSPVEATDATDTTDTADAVEAEVVETVAAEPVPAFEPTAMPAPVSIFHVPPSEAFHTPPSEPIAAEFADLTPLSDDLLPRKR